MIATVSVPCLARVITPAPGTPPASHYRRAFMIAKEFVPIPGIRSSGIMKNPAVLPISLRVRLSCVTTVHDARHRGVSPAGKGTGLNAKARAVWSSRQLSGTDPALSAVSGAITPITADKGLVHPRCRLGQRLSSRLRTSFPASVAPRATCHHCGAPPAGKRGIAHVKRRANSATWSSRPRSGSDPRS